MGVWNFNSKLHVLQLVIESTFPVAVVVLIVGSGRIVVPFTVDVIVLISCIGGRVVAFLTLFPIRSALTSGLADRKVAKFYEELRDFAETEHGEADPQTNCATYVRQELLPLHRKHFDSRISVAHSC